MFFCSSQSVIVWALVFLVTYSLVMPLLTKSETLSPGFQEMAAVRSVDILSYSVFFMNFIFIPCVCVCVCVSGLQ